MADKSFVWRNGNLLQYPRNFTTAQLIESMRAELRASVLTYDEAGLIPQDGQA